MPAEGPDKPVRPGATPEEGSPRSSAPGPGAADTPNIPGWVQAAHPSLSPAAGTGVEGAPTSSPPAAAPARKTATAPGPKGVERREFLNWLALGWISFTAATAAGLTALGRFFFPNVLFEPPSLFKVGFPEDFSEGVDNRFKEKYRVWVVREADTLFALYAQCTHLGCTPNWLETENKFKCPCHGSGFYRSGINFEGPAPRPLERVKISLAEDGQILVDKSVVYQQEKGQWTDPSSYLTV